MKNVNTSITQLIGKTPLLELIRYAGEKNISAKIIAKLEGFNPAGSAKDRVALAMVDQAELDGLLKPGGTIIEPTSGNTGIGLAMVAAARGYKVVLTMPDTMSMERRNLVKSYGAQVVLTDGDKGMPGAIAKAEELKNNIAGSVILGQFDNHANPQIHRISTGPEIWHDLDGAIDVFVAGVGSGGTLTGVAEFLKSKNPNIQVVAVEPAASPVLSGGQPGPHKLQGIGAGFVPTILNTQVYDEIIKVQPEDAYTAARNMAQREGVLIGISGGAALWAATQLAQRPENASKNIVVIIPDTGERYLSTELFEF